MSWYLAALAVVDTIALCIGKRRILFSMNRREQVPVFHMCLAGTVATSWSPTQEVVGLKPFTVMTNTFRHCIKENFNYFQ